MTVDFTEFQRNFTYQKGFYFVLACAANWRSLTEVNTSTVEAMQYFHEIVDVHGAGS